MPSPLLLRIWEHPRDIGLTLGFAGPVSFLMHLCSTIACNHMFTMHLHQSFSYLGTELERHHASSGSHDQKKKLNDIAGHHWLTLKW